MNSCLIPFKQVRLHSVHVLAHILQHVFLAVKELKTRTSGLALCSLLLRPHPLFPHVLFVPTVGL